MILTKPSFYAHLFTGVALLLLILFIYFHYKELKFTLYQKLILSLLIIIVVGIHGLSHHQLEVDYNFNPIENIFI